MSVKTRKACYLSATSYRCSRRGIDAVTNFIEGYENTALYHFEGVKRSGLQQTDDALYRHVKRRLHTAIMRLRQLQYEMHT